MQISRPQNTGRLVLIAAALIAAIAIGVSVWRSASPAGTSAAPVAGQPAAPVADVIGQLEKRLAGNSTDAEGWRMLGWSYFEVGRYADSAAAYGNATRIDPTKSEWWSAQGEALVLAAPPGRFPPQAATAFQRALAIDPKDPRARYFRGVELDMAGVAANDKAKRAQAVETWIALLNDTPPGAPWEENVRALVTRVGGEAGVEVAGRLPAQRTPPGSKGSAGAVATAGIPGPTREQMAAASALPPSQQDAMVKGMVDGLAARLAANPKDADGWIRLMRARMVLNDQSRANQALVSARQAFAGDAPQLARLTEAAKALGVPGA